MASIVTRTRDYTAEVVEELGKDTRPDWPQLRNSTYEIIDFVILVSLIIFVMDVVVRNVLELIINVFAR